MKTMKRLFSWYQRHLKWMLLFNLIMSFFLWWWTVNLDRIGFWLWRWLHGDTGEWVIPTVLGVLGAVCLGMGIVKFTKGGRA